VCLKSLKRDLRAEALLELMGLRTLILTQILSLLVQPSLRRSNSNNRRKRKRKDVAEEQLFLNNMYGSSSLNFSIVYNLSLYGFDFSAPKNFRHFFLQLLIKIMTFCKKFTDFVNNFVKLFELVKRMNAK
jgi:hypothetical protein